MDFRLINRVIQAFQAHSLIISKAATSEGVLLTNLARTKIEVSFKIQKTPFRAV